MSQASIGIRSFNGGLIDRETEGRTDLKQYAASAREVTNFIPKVNGSLTRRPGTRYVTTALSSTQPSRLIPFPVGDGENYLLEMNDREMRIFKGDSVLQTSSVTVEAGSFYQGGVFRPGTAHGFYHGQKVQISGTAPGVTANSKTVTTVGSGHTLTSTSHGFVTGDPVRVVNASSSSSVPSELNSYIADDDATKAVKDARTLYVTYVNANTFKLSVSYPKSGATGENAAAISITNGSSYNFLIKRDVPYATSTDYYVCLPKAVVIGSAGRDGTTQDFPLGYDGASSSTSTIYTDGITDNMGPYKLSGDSWNAYPAVGTTYNAANPDDDTAGEGTTTASTDDERSNLTTGEVYLSTCRDVSKVSTHVEISKVLGSSGDWPSGSDYNLELNITLTPTPVALAKTFHLSTDPEDLYGSIIRHGYSPATTEFTVGPVGVSVEEVTFTTPYASTASNDEVAELDYSQKADRLFFYHKNHPTMELNRWADGKLRFQQTPFDATPVGPQGRIKGAQVQLGNYSDANETVVPYITDVKQADLWGNLYRALSSSSMFTINNVGQTFARFGNYENFLSKAKYSYNKVNGQPLQMTIGLGSRLGSRFFQATDVDGVSFDGGTWSDTDHQQYQVPGNTMVPFPVNEVGWSIVAGTDQITLGSGHGFVDNEPISFRAGPGGLPPEISENTVYFVRDTASTSIKIAATKGGTAVALTEASTYTGARAFTCAFKMMFKPNGVNTADFSTLGIIDPLEYATVWFDGGVPPEGIYPGTKYRVRIMSDTNLTDRFYLEHASDNTPVSIRSNGSGLCYMSVDFGASSVLLDVRSDYDPGGSGYMQYWGTNKWFDPIWGALNGYPQYGTQYEQRHVLAGTPSYPNQVWMSRTGIDNDFFIMEANAEPAVRTAKGRGYIITDASGFGFQPSSNQTSPIQWIVGHNSLLLATSTDVFEISSSSERLAITPTNVNARSISTGGAAPIRPVRAGMDIIYVSASRSAILGLLFDGGSAVTKPQSLTQFSSDVVSSAPEELAWQEEPEPILWVRRNDGRLYGCTYNREQSVVAWHKHEIAGIFGTGQDPDSFGHVTGITVLPHTGSNRRDDYDRLWMCVKRTIDSNTVQYIEYMAPPLRDWEEDKEGHYVDSSPADYSGTVDHKYHYSWSADFSNLDTVTNAWNPGTTTSASGNFPHFNTTNLNSSALSDGFRVEKRADYASTYSGDVGFPSSLLSSANDESNSDTAGIPIAICSGTDATNPIPANSISATNKYLSMVMTIHERNSGDGRLAAAPSSNSFLVANEGGTIFLGTSPVVANTTIRLRPTQVKDQTSLTGVTETSFMYFNRDPQEYPFTGFNNSGNSTGLYSAATDTDADPIQWRNDLQFDKSTGTGMLETGTAPSWFIGFSVYITSAASTFAQYIYVSDPASVPENLELVRTDITLGSGSTNPKFTFKANSEWVTVDASNSVYKREIYYSPATETAIGTSISGVYTPYRGEGVSVSTITQTRTVHTGSGAIGIVDASGVSGFKRYDLASDSDDVHETDTTGQYISGYVSSGQTSNATFVSGYTAGSPPAGREDIAFNTSSSGSPAGHFSSSCQIQFTVNNQSYPPQYINGVQVGTGSNGAVSDSKRSTTTGLYTIANGASEAEVSSERDTPLTITWDLSLDSDLATIDPDAISYIPETEASPSDYSVTLHGVILGKDVPGPDILPVQISSPNVDSQSTTVPFNATNGLDHLIGQTVAVYADAKELASVVPDSSGNATISQRSNYVAAGLGYTSSYTSIPLEATVEGQTTIQGFKKRVVDAFLRVSRAFGGKIGQDSSNLTSLGNTADGVNTSKTGIVATRGMQHEWDEEAIVHVKVEGPAPFTLNSITARTDWSER